jgi:hypothetical protein
VIARSRQLVPEAPSASAPSSAHAADLDAAFARADHEAIGEHGERLAELA